MEFFKRLLGKNKSPQVEVVTQGRAKVIPDSELAFDANAAQALIVDAGRDETAIGLSADGNRVFFVSNILLTPDDIRSLRKSVEQGRIEFGHRYFQMPTCPVFVIGAAIMDNPSNPFELETYLNIGAPQGEMLLSRIRRGGSLGICFHFYDPNGTLLFRTGYKVLSRGIPELGQDIVKAKAYLESLPPTVLNYPLAVQRVIQENP
jgi:hypothetical protein